MGSTLSIPITSKAITRTGTNKLRVSACEMQGYRASMEDSKAIILDPSDIKASSRQHGSCSFFGVFDGHCCEDAAQWFSEHLPQKILELPNFEANSIKNACLEADLGYKAYIKQSGSAPGGTTAVFAILQEVETPKNPQKPYRMIVGNIGDSRCLLVRDGKQLEQVTKDHKPTNAEEKKRIIAAGGNVVDGRVDQMLAVSRALGDPFFKVNSSLPAEQQKVSAVPDVFVIEEVGGNDIVLLICDGVVERSSNKQAFAALKKNLDQNPQDPALALSKMESAQIACSSDNMTAIMVEFTDGSLYSRLKGELEYVPMKFHNRHVYRLNEEQYENLQHSFEHFGARYGHLDPHPTPSPNASAAGGATS